MIEPSIIGIFGLTGEKQVCFGIFITAVAQLQSDQDPKDGDRLGVRVLPAVPFSHYVIVRRDLPVGVAAAQIVHASGESAQLGELPPRTHAVLLSARDESHLLAIEKMLLKKGVNFRAIREPDEPWSGQLMAIGVVPAPTDAIKRHFGGIPLYR